ncbi:MAG TPA: sigma-70 family RNA polymerase sigma factor [Pyrinomonadaceae bacterium]|nr:sigma-70 family RNA polymerase sigma factor [Pyrinomonadaceae bacterium]
MNDAVAIEKCKAGDRDAFRHLVERYQAEALGHARAILADREDALDAVQESFLDAYQALGKFDVSRQFYPWFYTILRNRCFKLAAGRKKNVGLELEEALVLAPVSEVAPEDRLALERALLELSAAERELLTLRHLDGLSYEELAERLEIPRGTVMSRLYHARRRLREKLVNTDLEAKETIHD